MLKKDERICKGCKGIINLNGECYKEKYMKRSKYFCSENCLVNYLKKHGLYGYKDEEYIKENYIKIKGEKMEIKLDEIIKKNYTEYISTKLINKDSYVPDHDAIDDFGEFQFYALKNNIAVTYPNFKEYRNKKIV